MNLLDVFANSDDLVEFPAGATIIHEGEKANHMYVVMKGDVIISLKTRVLARAYPGDIIGEMALVNSDIRSATVTARCDCQLVMIDESSFNALLKHVPDFTLHVMNVLATRLRSAYDMIDE